MKVNYFIKMAFAVLLGFFGLNNVNAQSERVDIVEIPAFDDGIAQRYLADVDDVTTFVLEQDENSQWYRIPAGNVSNGTEDVEAYYYKNVATGKYLCISEASLAELEEKKGGDWPMSQATTSATNDESSRFKWFNRPGHDWPWAVWFSNAAGIDMEQPLGNHIYTLMSISLMNGPGSEFFGVDYPNAAVGGFKGGYPGNAWSAVKTPVVLKTALNLDNLPFLGDGVTYDADTQTITYPAAWRYAGWEWNEGADFSDFNSLAITLNTGGLTAGTEIEICVSYVGGNGDGDYIVKTNVKDEMQTITIPVGVGNRKNSAFVDEFDQDATQVWRIGTKNSGAGTVVLESVVFYNADLGLQYSIDKLNFFGGDGGFDDTASSYNEETKTITYNSGWKRAGWDFEPDGGFNASKFNQVFIEFDASALPKTGDGEGGSTKLQFDVEYMDGTRETSTTNEHGNEYRANATQAMYNLTKAKDQRIIKFITLKSEVAGDVVLTDAYFFDKPADPIDLIITDIRWEPVKPAPGDSVTFFATIKNDSEFATPDGEKHGVLFFINGVSVSWSDGHYDSMAAGEEIELSTTMEGSSGALWETGKDASYFVRAQVNDSQNLVEVDYENNYSETKTLDVDGFADLEVVRISWEWDSDNDDIQVGDKVIFTASVVNNGTVNTPRNVKHGVAFSVNGTVVSWSDDHYESILANGLRTRLEANDGPTKGINYWVANKGGEVVVSAHVNDGKIIPESNYENNILTANLIVETVNIIQIAGDDSYVYTENGTLYIVGYPSTASLQIYDLAGQKVADFKTIVEGQSVQLSAGAYIVKISEKGKASTQKVIIK